MAAYNWIVFDSDCPQCGETALIKSMTTVAASYCADEHGRFFDQTFGLMDEMRWWAQSDARWKPWACDATPSSDHIDAVDECCYTECTACRGALFAVIEFMPIHAVRVKRIGLEEDWPSAFLK
jgi:hypothetical protein